MVKTLINTYKLHIPTQITTVIFKDNQKHLLKNVIFIKKLNPEISHFVWNVLDPEMMPKEGKKNKDKILPNLEIA
jgi:MoaA/NifB/PqqE/SkfB family radical SAM enzyme